SSRGGRHGTPPLPSPRRPGPVARAAALPLVPFPLRQIPRFFVPGGRAARRPILGPPAPNETTTVTAAESCTANAPVASSTLLYSYLRATIGSTFIARRAGM